MIPQQSPYFKARALHNLLFKSANLMSMTTDMNGLIQIFDVDAQDMLGYPSADILNRVTPADISDPQDVISRARELSEEFSTSIAPGFETLVFKASRGQPWISNWSPDSTIKTFTA